MIPRSREELEELGIRIGDYASKEGLLTVCPQCEAFASSPHGIKRHAAACKGMTMSDDKLERFKAALKEVSHETTEKELLDLVHYVRGTEPSQKKGIARHPRTRDASTHPNDWMCEECASYKTWSGGCVVCGTSTKEDWEETNGGTEVSSESNDRNNASQRLKQIREILDAVNERVEDLDLNQKITIHEIEEIYALAAVRRSAYGRPVFSKKEMAEMDPPLPPEDEEFRTFEEWWGTVNYASRQCAKHGFQAGQKSVAKAPQEGWVCERDREDYVEYLTTTELGYSWTADIDKAVLCCRREDADRFCAPAVDDVDRIVLVDSKKLPEEE